MRALLLLLLACATLCHATCDAQRSSARSLTHYDGGHWAPSRFDPTVPAFCLPSCGAATDSTLPTCPPGTTPQNDTAGNLLNCWKACPSGYTLGPNPTNASDPNQWCIITTTCPTGWEPTGDTDPSDGLTCRRCPPGYTYQESPAPNVAAGCYRDCDLVAPLTFPAYVAIGASWVPMCCTPCGANYQYACVNGICRCANVNDPTQSQFVRCTNRFVPARTQTFTSFADTSARPTCPFGWKAFQDANGAWHCYSCASVAATSPHAFPYQLPDGSVTCICPTTCPSGSRFCNPLCWRWADSWGWNPWAPVSASGQHDRDRQRSNFCASIAYTFADCVPLCSAVVGPITVG